jgi:hypothetical protein
MANASDSESPAGETGSGRADILPGKAQPSGAGIPPSKAEIKARVAFEGERRARLGVPTAAGGVLYLLSGIILSATLKGIPTVGVLQGVAPALRGEANPVESPLAAELRFESHHSFGAIAGSVLVAIAYAAIVLVLLFVLDSVRFRRPQTGGTARWLILVGGGAVAALSVIYQVLLAVRTHEFATGHDFSAHAVDAVKHNSVVAALAYLTPLAGIALAAGMIITVLNGSRTGLLPRWVAMVGGVSAVLLLLPTALLDVVVAFWMVALGILMMERWPSGDPPAWASGEAIPWPTQAELREAEEGGAAPGRGAQGGAGKGRAGQGGAAQGDVAPEPALPVKSSSRKRRKRSASR